LSHSVSHMLKDMKGAVSQSKGTKGALAKAVFNSSKDTSFSVINSAKGSKDLGRGVVAYGVEVRNSVAKGRIEKDSGQVFCLEGAFLNKTPTKQPFPKENPGGGIFLKSVNWR